MADRISTEISSGSKYDLDFCNWNGSNRVTGVANFTLGDISKKSSGLIKATNKLIKILLTRKGSDPFNPDLGTYMDDIQFRGGKSEGELGTFIAEQLTNALRQLRDIQSVNNFPDDENIITAKLTNVERSSADSLRVNISIISEAGTGTNIAVPIIGG